jgi:hypothetical protein
VEASPEFVIITHGFDGRFDSPNILAEPSRFKEGDAENMTWAEDKTLLKTLDIV